LHGIYRSSGNLPQRYNRCRFAIKLDRRRLAATELSGALRPKQDQLELIGLMLETIKNVNLCHLYLPSGIYRHARRIDGPCHLKLSA
jgi:hypothetical protein